MNILFFKGIPFKEHTEGIGTVSLVLASYFESQGNKCFFLAHHNRLNWSLPDNHYLLPEDADKSEANTQFIVKLVDELKIDIIINQLGDAGYPEGYTQCLFEAKKRLKNFRVISVFHGSLFDSYRYGYYVYADRLEKMPFGQIIRSLFKYAWFKETVVKYKQFVGYSYFRHIYQSSDKILTLCEGYTQEYKNFIKCDGTKLATMPNPVTIQSSHDIESKEKIVLWVGRIAFGHKRPDMMVDIWNKISDKIPDWVLHIAGNGNDMDTLQQKIKDTHARNIIVHGQVNPLELYQRASIFCMTSTFEGFPLVLFEAMSNTAVPIAFNSFKSAKDIIDEECGSLITPFDTDEYANTLLRYIQDENLRKQKAEAAYRKSKLFSLETIGAKWIQILKHLS